MKKRIFKMFLLIILMLCSLQNVEALNQGKVTLTYQNNEYKSILDIDVLLYKLADYDIKNLGKITVLKDYQDLKLDFNDISQETMKSKTKAISQYISNHALKQDQLIKVNQNGQAVFNHLDDGIYFIQGRYRGNDYDVSIEPTLIVMPHVYDQQFVYQYDLHPKMTVQKKKQYQDYTVLKVWKDSNNKEHLRPDFIKVGLYANKKLVQTVQLDASSNWSYTWNHLDSHKNWSVKEININRNYISHIKKTNNQFLIENELKDTTHIKTGDYQPVIIFIVLLVISIVSVIYLTLKKKN